MSRRPGFVHRASDSTRIAFRGGMPAPLQTAVFAVGLGMLAALLGGAAAAILILGVPLAHRWIRQRGAPTLELRDQQLQLDVGGETLRVARQDLVGARAIADGDHWKLSIERVAGAALVVDGTGSTAVELAWVADIVTRWVAGETALPDVPDRVVDEGLGSTTFVVPTRLSSGDQAVVVGLVASMVGVWLASIAYHDPALRLLLVPFLAIVGHLVGARSAGRTEVRVGAQSVRVEVDQPRVVRRTLAYEDLARVEAVAGDVVLVPKDGRALRIRVDESAVALVEAIEQARAAAPTVGPDPNREKLRDLARLAARARE